MNSANYHILLLFNEIITSVIKAFNKHKINIIENPGDQKPTNKAREHNVDNDGEKVDIIRNSNKNYPCLFKVKSEITTNRSVSNDHGTIIRTGITCKKIPL